MKYTQSIPQHYRLSISAHLTNEEIILIIKRNGETVITCEDNPNIDALSYMHSLLDQVEDYSRRHYERADAVDRRKTGGSVDVERAIREAYDAAADLLEQIIYDAEDESRRDWDELESWQAWRIVNLANGRRDKQAAKAKGQGSY